MFDNQNQFFRSPKEEIDEGSGHSIDKRFASSLLEKLLSYVDKAAQNMLVITSSKHFTKCDSIMDQNEEIKFFGKVGFSGHFLFALKIV